MLGCAFDDLDGHQRSLHWLLGHIYMDVHAAAFWTLLFVGLPGTLMLWTHRSNSIQRIGFQPLTLLVLIGLGITATSSIGQYPAIVAEIGLFTSFIIGILAMGTYLMVFGGVTPVGPVPRGWRASGSLLLLSTVVILGLLTTGPEWLFLSAPQGWPSFAASGVVGLVSTSIFGIVIVWIYGDGRWITLIGLILTSSLGLAGSLLWIESGVISTTEISNALTTAIGSLLGIILSAMIAIALMVQIESGATVPKISEPLSDKEIERMKEIIEVNLGGEEE